MLALDTSVVVRLLIGEPPKQFAAAKRRVQRAVQDSAGVLLSDLVVFETWQVLKYHYEVPAKLARDKLRALVESGVVRLQSGSGIPESLEDVKGGAGFLDRLIVAHHNQLGAKTLTFDARQAKLNGATKLRG